MFLLLNSYCRLWNNVFGEPPKHYTLRCMRGGAFVAIGLLLTLVLLIGYPVWAGSAADLPDPTVAGVHVNLTVGNQFYLLIDGREVGRETNLDLMLPLGTHVFLVQVANVSSNDLSAVTLDPIWGVGAWIWDYKTFDKQTIRLWRSFEIPPGTKVVRAKLDITADNGYRLLLDGREIGKGSDLRHVTEYDLSWLLQPGRHVLAVEAFNDYQEAGVLAGLKIELTDGKLIDIPSDVNWRIVPLTERGWETRRAASADWPHAVIVGRFKSSPWAYLPAGFTRLPPIHPVQVHFWNTGWFQVTLLIISGLSVLACVQLLTRLAGQSKSRDLLQRERSRIARDIHDELGAGLTQLLLLGEVVRKEAWSAASSQTGIERMCGKARGLATTVDEIVWAVNSRHDMLQDFARHVCKFAQSFFANTAIRCRLDVASEIPSLQFDLPVRRSLFLAVKEVLNNAAKHSGANELFLRIHIREKSVVVSVEDNGKGFDPVLASKERNGLTNLKQRMAEIDGTCEVISKPGEGCRVTLKVSLSKSPLRMVNWFRRPRDVEETKRHEVIFGSDPTHPPNISEISKP